MFQKKIIFITILLLLLSLIIRELPYINVLVAGKIWIFYGLLFLFLIFPWKVHPSLLILLSMFLLLTALLFTLAKLYNFTEILGLAIYFLLWLAVILRIVDFLKSEKNK